MVFARRDRKGRSSAWLAAAVLSLAGAARAQSDETFGAPGRVLITGAFQIRNVSTDAAGSRSVTTVEVSPGVNVFVAKNLALGARLEFLVASGAAELSSIAFLPSLGFNLDLGPGISWLPQVQLGLSHTSSGSGAASVSVTRWAVGAFAPLIVRPAGHFFVGVGPDFLVDFAASANVGNAARQTLIGVQAMLGGWF